MALLIVGLAWGGGRAAAASFVGFGLSAFNITNSAFFTNTSITTVITVTNDTGFFLDTAYITNDFSAAVTFEQFTNYGTNGNTYNIGTNDVLVTGNTAVFAFENFTNTGVAQLTVTWQPQEAGLITNTITVGTPDVIYTASTNLVSLIYGGESDFGVNVAFVSQAYVTNLWVITNDWVTYTVAVTNLGTVTAYNVQLTNTLPTGLKLIPPSNYSVVSNNVVFNVGTLVPGAGTQYQFNIQPTNTGVYTLAAVVGATNLYSPSNAINNGSNILGVTNYLAGTFLAVTNTGQKVDQQNGLIEQMIQVTNTSASFVQAVRVVVTGLTNKLYNASGTNAGYPYVVYPVALAPGGQAGSQVGMRLQYSPRLPFPFTNGQLHAYEVPATVLNYTPPTAQTSTNFDYYRLASLTDGDMLLEFTNLGGTYTVIYSDNLQFSNAMIATPAVQSGANRIQWLDYGPPATISAPTNDPGGRYYKVIMNP